jgi:hypothetical protein
LRALIAPLGCEVKHALGQLDARLARIARRYIRRLGLEPYLGPHADRGLLAEYGCRRIRFDSHDLQPSGRSPKRHPSNSLTEGATRPRLLPLPACRGRISKLTYRRLAASITSTRPTRRPRRAWIPLPGTSRRSAAREVGDSGAAEAPRFRGMSGAPAMQAAAAAAQTPRRRGVRSPRFQRVCFGQDGVGRARRRT